jgi:hypothetical protein
MTGKGPPLAFVDPSHDLFPLPNVQRPELAIEVSYGDADTCAESASTPTASAPSTAAASLAALDCEWYEVQFQYKPTDPSIAPPWVPLGHMPRLDWQVRVVLL